MTTERRTRLHTEAGYGSVTLPRRQRRWRDEMQLRALFTRFLKAKVAGGAAAGTERQYDLALQQFTTYLHTTGHRETLTNFNHTVLQDYLIHLHRFLKPNSVHNRLCALSSFGKWLVRQGILQANPVDRLDRPKQVHSIPAVLSATELAILDAVDLPMNESAMRALLAHGGLRCIEVCSLDHRDVNPTAGDYGMLYVRKAKGGVGRTIPLADPALREPVIAYLLATGPRPPEEPIFRGVDTYRLRDEQLRVIVSRWGQAIGRRDLHPHLLRHTFGTLWIERGGNVAILQEIMGHKQLNTTKRYVHLAPSHLATEIARIAQHTPKNYTMNLQGQALDADERSRSV